LARSPGCSCQIGLLDGLISHISDFWPVPYDPPAGREHLTERY
jgi:hypothetical protein